MYSIISKDVEFTPARYMVFVEIAYHANCGFKPTEKMIGRVGSAKTMEGARKHIEADKKAMGETYGGMIEPIKLKHRTYSIWDAASWTEVK
jgi:hypothetical protein